MSGRPDDQAVVDAAYRRLDRLRARVDADLAAALRGEDAGTPAARALRDAEVERLAGLRARLAGVEEQLVFGRVDLPDATVHVGRLGVDDEDRRRLVVDWRAPAARDYYQATAARPGQVLRRRHLRVEDRRVTAVEDDLLATVRAARGGRLRQVVATLQAEQDRVVRAPLPGVLVVQGAPGTGKTAVALHRAAYLLYTHRDRLTRRGVLLVGPSRRFLDHVSAVLPGLGETSVVATTLAGLVPDVPEVGPEDDDVAALKGDPRMARLLERAVAQWRRVPAGPVPLQVDEEVVVLRPEAVVEARSVAGRTGGPHNRARDAFCAVVLDDLRAQLAAATGTGPDDPAIRARLHAAPDVRREVNLCWMPLSPQRVLSRLYADRERLRRAAADLLTPAERALLHRPVGDAWTAADLPLLDELAALLGPLPAAREARARDRRATAERAEQVRFAEDSLAGLGLDGWVAAEVVVDRWAGSGAAPGDPLADPDRTWGHLVVDEAQDLSPMAWRMLVRRCPNRSMTVVGDPAQATAPGAPGSWAEVLDLIAPGRWRLEELSVNYRTPGRIARHADEALGGPVPRARPLDEGDPPRFVRLRRDDVAALAALVGEVAGDSGSVVVVVPPGRRDRLRVGVPVLEPDQVKGLEVEHVVVVDPDAIARGPRGRAALHVALTRATRSLVVVSPG